MRRASVLVALVVVCLGSAASAEEAPPLAVADVDRPTLLWIDAEGIKREMPLVKGHAKVDVRGPIAQVQLTQTFANPSEVPIESVYVFPLPEKGAVGAMTMTIGTRTIRAKIKKRAEARELYERAKREGKTAALLEQERPNVFTQSVANILPGEQIDVALTYDLLLAPTDGVYELAIPTVVGPRYIPAHVEDADRISPPVSTRQTGNMLGLDLDIEAGLPITEVISPTHTIVTTRLDDSRYQIALAEGDLRANKDFVLRWRVVVKSPAIAVLAHKEPDAEYGHVALVVQPPEVAPEVAPGKRELVFIVDTSGSMDGEPIAMVKRAMRYALARLGPDDAFRLYHFADEVAGLSGGRLHEATRANVERALAYVDDLDADGGTQMIHGVRAALAGVPEEGRTRYVCFMTDGYIGNEQEMFAAIDDQIDHATYLFSFGVGSSVNRHLLDGLAAHGGGVARYLLLDQDPAPQIEEFFAQVETPLLGGLRIEWDGLDVVDATPSKLRHLFAGQPVVFAGRYKAGGRGTAIVRGRSGDQDIALRIRVNLTASGGDGSVLARLWARRRIEELEASQVAGEQPGTVDAITELALAHSLRSRYTSFVAVEEIRRSSQTPRTVEVPVELPEGVSTKAIGAAEQGGEVDYYEYAADVEDDGGGGMGGAYSEQAILLGSAASVSRYYRGAVDRRWMGAVDLGLGADTRGDTRYLALSASLERRVAGLTAVGVTGTTWSRDEHARLYTLLGTLARWALFGVADLRVGAGTALTSGEVGFAWQVRLGLPLPVPSRFAPELELRLDRAHLAGDDHDLLGIGAGVGFRF